MSRYGIGLGLAAAAAFYTGNNYFAVKNSIAVYTEFIFSIKLMILKYIWGIYKFDIIKRRIKLATVNNPLSI